MNRVLVVAGAAMYVLSALAIGVLYFMAEGSFSAGSRFFWAYTGLPPLVFVLHLAAGAVLLWKWERAAAPVVAVEVMILAGAVTGAALFWVTGRWLLLAGVLRASVVGVVVLHLWGRLAGQRLLAVGLGALGLALGIAWAASLRPEPAATRPMIAGAAATVTVWQRVGPAAAVPGDAATFDLGGGGKVHVFGDPPTVDLVLGETLVRISPMPPLQELSVDGAWTTTLNRIGMGFRQPSQSMAWQDGGRHYMHFRYSRAERAASRLARAEAYRRLTESVLTGDLHVCVDPQAGAIDLVALTGLHKSVCARNTAFFQVMVQPYAGQKVVLPIGDAPLGWDPSSGPPPRRFVNLQDGGAVLYDAGPLKQGPFRELAAVADFASYLVIEGLAGGNSVLVYYPDWKGQSLMGVSPSAGEPVRANGMALEYARIEPGADAGGAGVIRLTATAALAETVTGRGCPVVRMSAGTYVNRMSVRIVPGRSDYRKVIEGLSLWQPPER